MESGRFGGSGESEARDEREQSADGDVGSGEECEDQCLGGRVSQFVRRGPAGQREDLFGGIDQGHIKLIVGAKVENPA